MKKKNFIRIQNIPDYNDFSDLVISGEFNITNNEKSIQSKNSDILKHIILVVTRSGNYQSVTPFNDVIVFNDDVNIEEDVVTGTFKILLSDHINFSGEGDYFIFCSLGTFLSNTIEIKL